MLDNLLNALGCVKVSIWLTPWWLQSNNTKWKSSIKCYQSRRWQNNLFKEVQTKIPFFGLFFHFFKSCLLTWDASGNIAQACSDSPRIPAGTCSIQILQKMKHFLKPTELCRQSQSHLHQPHRSWRALHSLELLVPTPIMHCDHFPCYRSNHHLLCYQYHQHHHNTCEAQAQVMFSAAVMLVSKPKIGTPVSFATHLHCSWWKKN